jgi:methyltransferase-like protein/2-polyprenyl-3-methyl-5-hydroxy-6-metoxy-1,4-benzoquinol methylase
MADRARASYDEMPYTNKAFPQTHPDRLATMARLFGVEAPAIEACRVLELGCASGGNLIPMALSLPAARFVGIDFSRRQIDDGRQLAAALQISNLELRCADIAEVDGAWGTFDYIVCHGIYSWVSEPIRASILAICNANLARDGVAFVSYNTYPGWHMRGMIREMLVQHCAGAGDPASKARDARAFLAFLAQGAPPNSTYAHLVNEELAQLRRKEDTYVLHEFLEDDNQPFYFHEFAAAAARHGLQYLAEADYRSMLPESFPPPAAESLRRLGGDVLRTEQYIDFLRGRRFRQTLLVHEGATIERRIDAMRLRQFHIAAIVEPATPPLAMTQGVAATLRAPNGNTFETAHAITKAALQWLTERWPLAFPFAELLAAARARVAPGAAAESAALARDEQALASDLLDAYGASVIELRVRSPRLALVPSERPVASPLVRLQIERGLPLTNLRHENVPLDPANRQVLRLMDGTRHRDALVAAMTRMAQEGVIVVQHEGARLTAGPKLEQILRAGLAENLPRFARAGLLVA